MSQAPLPARGRECKKQQRCFFNMMQAKSDCTSSRGLTIFVAIKTA